MPNKTSLKANLEKFMIDKLSRSVDFDNKHTKPLFLNVDFEGVRWGKLLVDTGATINIMSLFVFRKLEKTRKDLYTIQISVTDFSGL